MPANLAISVDPPAWAALRGHQFTDWGFYMAPPAFERYVRDLIVFGTNSIEFAHITFSNGDGGGRDDAADLVRMAGESTPLQLRRFRKTPLACPFSSLYATVSYFLGFYSSMFTFSFRSVRGGQ